MEVPNVEQLLDYVFTPEDFADDPSTQEYKKLVRVMKVRLSHRRAFSSLYCLFVCCFFQSTEFIFVSRHYVATRGASISPFIVRERSRPASPHCPLTAIESV